MPFTSSGCADHRGFFPLNRLQTHLGVVAVLSTAAALMFWPLFRLSFWGDDTFLILHTSRYNLIELLFLGPARAISRYHFMPLLGLSFYIDARLFQLDFVGRNLHNFFWLAAVGYSSYLLFRELGLRVWSSLSGGIGAMAMPATISVAGLYSNRNYLFGLAFAILTLTAAVRWSRQQKPRWLYLSLFFYFLSIASKEVYLSVAIPALAISWRCSASRRKVAMGYSALLLSYFVMRWAMLGSAIGGYPPGIDVLTVLEYFPRCVPRLLQTLVWGGETPGVISCWAVTIGAFWIMTTVLMSFTVWGRQGIFRIGGLIFLSLCISALAFPLPLIRYADDPLYCHGDRLALAFSFTVWAAFWYLVHVSLSRIRIASGPRFLLPIVVLVPLALFGGIEKANSWRHSKATIDQAEFVRTHAARPLLIVSEPTWFLNDFVSLIERVNPECRLQPFQRYVYLGFEGLRLDSDIAHRESGVLLIPPGRIVMTDCSAEIQQWSHECIAGFCRLFPFRCIQENRTR